MNVPTCVTGLMNQNSAGTCTLLNHLLELLWPLTYSLNDERQVWLVGVLP